ncbi:MAG: carboxy-S-adenosyl-L-methionine synthase CmoA [Proteobacteria bacterium]|nr:carboxy-S-adenosyl-L-methionine synthase CmoA [Pseudomonadota bacterium]
MPKRSNKDRVFAKPLSDVKAFEFNEDVTRVFQDMITRSVPGYELLLQMIALYASVFVRDKSNIYDLGCSLGEVSRLIAEQTRKLDCAIIAVDNSPSMIRKCQQFGDSGNIDWRCDDIQNIEISNASMVVLNLTLLFIDRDQRQSLITGIARGLNEGGVLVLSEKVVLDPELENQHMVQLHQAFKKMRGYSDLEISQKRTALENVLLPDSQAMHQQRLKQAGFSEVYQCFRCFNFVSYLAIK